MPERTTAAATREILAELKQRQVRFLLLQFTDLLGVNKAVEVPPSQFERALAGEVVFDGSALEGFARVEEADALLVPDLDTFRVFPWAAGAAGEQGDGGGGGLGSSLVGGRRGMCAGGGRACASSALAGVCQGCVRGRTRLTVFLF